MIPEATALDGVFPAVVTSNKDPLNAGRVKVVFPWLDGEVESHWARLVQPYAGKQRGLFFMPEVGDEVLVVFELGSFDQPLVIGGTWNGNDVPPEPGDPDGHNDHKVFETRSGHKLQFGDKPGAEFIQLNDSSLNNVVRWDSVNNTVSITAATGDIYIEAPQGAINLKAREIFFKVTDASKRTVGGNESVTVKQSASEGASNSKKWTASTSLTSTSKKVDLTSSSSFTVSGGSAKIDITQQDADKITVGGATTDTVGSLSVDADEVFEKAKVRTWSIGSASLKADMAITFDGSGPVTLMAGMTNVDAGGGDFSLLGSVVATLGGLILLQGGQLAFAPP